MIAMHEPSVKDITIYGGTDVQIKLRRKHEDNTPIIPSEAKLELRDKPGGRLWATAHVVIDADGWVNITFPNASVVNNASQKQGVYDLKVTVNGKKFRWLMGKAIIDEQVTV